MSMIESAVESLLLDLLEWVKDGGKTNDEVMDAWRTLCPRLPVWEEANDRGFVARDSVNGCCIVTITLLGFAFLCEKNISQRQKAGPQLRAYLLGLIVSFSLLTSRSHVHGSLVPFMFWSGVA
jgi:hypothetical protein